MRMADVRFLLHPVTVQHRDDNAEVVLSGHFQPLYYGMEGELHSTDQQWTETVTLPANENADIEASVSPTGMPQGNLMSGSGQLQTQLELYTEARPKTGIPAVTALELGELRQPDPKRPSLILKRLGEQSLWELAKDNGSTVELIRSANDLHEEPEDNRMLLIPVV